MLSALIPSKQEGLGKYGACWAPGSVKGKGKSPSGDNFNLDGRIPLGHITTFREVPCGSGTGVISRFVIAVTKYQEK